MAINQNDLDRINTTRESIEKQYGAIVTTRDLRDILHYTSSTTVCSWTAATGLARRKLGRGRFLTQDVAAAIVLGKCPDSLRVKRCG